MGGLSVSQTFCLSVCLSVGLLFSWLVGWLVRRCAYIYTYDHVCRQTDRLHACMYSQI